MESEVLTTEDIDTIAQIVNEEFTKQSPAEQAACQLTAYTPDEVKIALGARNTDIQIVAAVLEAMEKEE